MLSIKSNKVLLALLALWLGVLASIRDLSIPDEGRYGDISRWMVQSHDWLIPRINGIPFLHKPPLLHWLSSGLMEIFGVHIWVLRLVPVLAACVMLCSMFWFIKKHCSEQLAQTSVLVLASSFLFYGSSQYINHDLLVASCMTLCILGFADFILSNSYKSLFIGYIACGLGFLSKGLIGILIPGMVLLPWVLATGQWRKIPQVLNPFGIMVLLLIVLPWPWLVEQHYHGFFRYFFIDQQFSRFSSGEFNNKQPWIFYIVCLLVSFLPWLLLSQFKVFNTDSKNQLGKPIYLLLIWWAASCVIFFSIPPSKIAGYILPAVPPLAILIATVINSFSHTKPSSILQKWGTFSILVLVCLFFLIAPHTHALNIAQLRHNYIIMIYSAFLTVIVIGIIAINAKNKISATHMTLTSAAVLCMSLTVLVKTLDTKNNADQMSFSQYVSKDTPVIFYHRYYYDVPFLLNSQKPVYVVNDWNRVISDSWALELKDGLQFEPQQEQYLINENDLKQKIASRQPLLIIASDQSIETLVPANTKKSRFRNYTVYWVNQT